MMSCTEDPEIRYRVLRRRPGRRYGNKRRPKDENERSVTAASGINRRRGKEIRKEEEEDVAFEAAPGDQGIHRRLSGGRRSSAKTRERAGIFIDQKVRQRW
jgi:hypothetical protein